MNWLHFLRVSLCSPQAVFWLGHAGLMLLAASVFGARDVYFIAFGEYGTRGGDDLWLGSAAMGCRCNFFVAGPGRRGYWPSVTPHSLY